MRTFLAWVVTIVYFMIIMPIGAVVQGLMTPIELIWNAVIFKICDDPFGPEDYFELYGKRMVRAFSGWFDEEEVEAEEEA